MKHGISGINNTLAFDQSPYLNKQTLGTCLNLAGRNLDRKIERLFRSSELVSIKKGLYVSSGYLQTNKAGIVYREFLANTIRNPSYLSLEYVLAENGLIPEAVNAFTSVTQKSSRSYTNELGNFIYRNIADELFIGYNRQNIGGLIVYKASTAKALFDFLYLKRNISRRINQEIATELRINWDNFTTKDMTEFTKFVTDSNSWKMKSILLAIRKVKNVS